MSPAKSLLLLLASSMLVVTGCWQARDHLPGDTGYKVREVRFEGASFDPGVTLRNKSAFRPDSLLFPGQFYNPYREGEDRRRIIAFWQTKGFFDVKVEGPFIKRDEVEKKADVTWKLDEGPAYTIASVTVENAPATAQSGLEDIVPFAKGDRLDLEKYRLVRIPLADYLRLRGHGHTEVWSRTFIDRVKKVVHWYYYVDAGPKTVVGNVTVKGNKAIPSETIVRRAGLVKGDPFDLAIQLKRESDLLDTGAFNIVKFATSADVEFLIGKLPPDTGGEMKPGMVDESGKFVGRKKLNPEIDIQITVVESPSAQVRFGLGGTVELTRLDAYASGKVLLRNVFGPLHHLAFDMKVGYGWLFRASNDDPLGIYGHGEVRYEYSGLFARLLDFRIFGRIEEKLFPGFHTRQVTAGMGFRSALGSRLFLDIVPMFRWEDTIGYGAAATTPEDAKRLKLSDETLMGFELAASLVWDERDNRVEALSGHFLKIWARFGPGAPLGTHRYLNLGLDVRGFIPVAENMSVALRGSGQFVLLGDEALPPGLRLFGGGAYGARVFGAQELTAYTSPCSSGASGPGCAGVAAGALSLVEASLEFRWLPFRQQLGAVVFVDAGAAGGGLNPFDNGVDVSAGIGGRVRLWYLPMALDIAVRLTDTRVETVWDRFMFFFRLGEAF